jgi:hypothetical protein
VRFLVQLIPLRGGEGEEIPARLEDATYFSGRDFWVRQMLKDLCGEDAIELGVAEGQGFGAAYYVHVRSGGNVHPHNGLSFDEMAVPAVTSASCIERPPGHVVAVFGYFLLQKMAREMVDIHRYHLNTRLAGFIPIVSHLLTRPVGRPPKKPIVSFAGFHSKPRVGPGPAAW